ncbi:hypothetical protein [Pigmentiphaga litoralis]|uniref:hypothetical protein n=1 Tax=Pigmentiphaga litoralis TaxID=516702 RepID=UPI003B42FD1A
MMKSGMVLAGVLLVLAGCASDNYVWRKEGASESRVEADRAACQQASNMSRGSFEASNRGQVGPGVDAAMRRSDQSMTCMRNRGYELVPAR